MRLALTALAFAGLSLVACSREPTQIRVGAAAVMRHAMPELAAAHTKATGVTVQVLYGASDRVAASSVDALIVADTNVVTTPTRPIASTSLVLVGPAQSPHRFATLRDAGVVAIGDPTAVPVGRYAKRYLEQLGAWDGVSARALLGGDVAGVLSLAQRGTAEVAIVYAADLADAAPLRQLDRAPESKVSVVAGTVSAKPAADAFVRFLSSTEAQAILARHGFAPP